MRVMNQNLEKMLAEIEGMVWVRQHIIRRTQAGTATDIELVFYLKHFYDPDDQEPPLETA